MDLRQLSIFQAVAKSASFTRAAIEMDYAQSHVTTQVRKLEDDLGVRLFDRRGKRIVLTEPGARLLDYSNRMLELAEETRSAVASDIPQGVLNVSATESLCIYRLPAVLRRLRRTAPEITVRFKPLGDEDLEWAVADGRIDVALAFIARRDEQRTATVVEPLSDEPFRLVCAPDHPAARFRTLTLEQMVDAELLLTEKGCSYRETFANALEAAGVVPQRVLEFSSVEAVKRCAALGLGIAGLPDLTVAAEIADGRLVDLESPLPIPAIPTAIVSPPEPGAAVRAFIEAASLSRRES